MEKYLGLLSSTALFDGIEQENISSMLGCLSARKLSFRRGESLFMEGDRAGFVGLVLEGEVQILRDDFYGKTSLMDVAGVGQLFAEVFACTGAETMPVSAYARTDCTVLTMDCRRIMTLCSNSCVFHNQIIKNLLKAVAEKTLGLSRKIRIMSQRSTKEKLLAYLSEQAKLCGSASFDISLDRQSLADYLGVERSAMSAELGKLRKEGLLECSGRHFRLLTEREEA